MEKTRGSEKPLEGVLFGKARVIGAFPTTQEEVLEKVKAFEERLHPRQRGRFSKKPKSEAPGESLMDSIKRAPVGSWIRGGSDLEFKKIGSNLWFIINAHTKERIMPATDESVSRMAHSMTVEEPARPTPAWPSTMYGSRGKKAEAVAVEPPKAAPEAPKVGNFDDIPFHGGWKGAQAVAREILRRRPDLREDLIDILQLHREEIEEGHGEDDEASDAVEDMRELGHRPTK